MPVKKVMMITMVGILFLSVSLPFGTCETISGNTLYVGGNGPGNYSKIQNAIYDTFDGDTVFVYSGTYSENVIINKAITLTGENRDTTIIVGDANEDVINIAGTDSVSVIGFTITNCGGSVGDAGVDLNSDKNIISGNIFIDNSRTGVLLHESNYNSITNNTFQDNGEGGIGFSLSGPNNNNIVVGNTFNNTGAGIWLWNGRDNIFYHNAFLKSSSYDDDGHNTWHNATLKEGNYWDDYTSTDSDGDGIGDTPYYIYGIGGSKKSIDSFPLMFPKKTDQSIVDSDGSDNKDTSNIDTPGFELLLAVCSIALVLLLKRKRIS